MNHYALFIDASLDPKLKIGVGGYCVVPESFMKTPSDRINISMLEETLLLRRFEGTSSTKLEVQTLLWALEEHFIASGISPGQAKLRIYSDSQCIERLLPRRARLEKSGFLCRGGARLLRNAPLYEKYYTFYDRLKFEVTKVAGHTRSRSRNTAERIFSFVDRKVRKALQSWMEQLEAERAEWYLYIVRCHDGSLYTGISNDMSRRLEKHREMGKQGAKYLRGRGPLELVFKKKVGNRSSALKMEQKIKKLSKSKKEIIIRRGDIDFVL